MPNLNCDSNQPHYCQPGEVRVLSLGAQGNAILCYGCFIAEMAWRIKRNRDLPDERKHKLEKWSDLRRPS